MTDLAAHNDFGIARDTSEPAVGCMTAPLVVVVIDIVGSTALARRIGDYLFASIIEEFRALVRSYACEFNGVEFSDTGDGFIHLFEHSTDALSALVQVFRSNDVLNQDRRNQIELRAAIHQCRLLRSTTGLIGVALHDACEMGQNADPGEIWLSDDTGTGFGAGSAPGGSRLVQLPKAGWRMIVPVEWRAAS